MTPEITDIDDERRSEIEALEAKLGTANYYEFLGVAPGASTEEIRAAFHALSKRFHPDRFFGKNLGSYKARIDTIFKRIVEANHTLSDPEKLAAYLAANPFIRARVKAATPQVTEGEPKTAEALSRDAERRARLARHPYLAKSGRVSEALIRTKAHIAKSEYAHAFTLLNMAIQVDPANVELKSMLIDVKRKNEEQRSEVDLKRGIDAQIRGDEEAAVNAYKASVNANPKNADAAFRAATLIARRNEPREASSFAQKAVDAAPENVDYRVLLARLLEDAGMKAMAKKHFEEAVKLAPEHPDVKKYAKRRWPF